MKILPKTTFFQKHTDNAIIIAGLGRCGTTVVQKSIKKSCKVKSSRVFIDSFNMCPSLQKNQLYKTHAFPAQYELPDHVKVIFLFGNPMDIVLSVNNKFNTNRLKLHYHHLESPYYKEHYNIIHQDTLQLEKQFKAWHQKQKFDFCSIKYETLFSSATQNKLNDYLGFKIKFPKFAKRKNDWTKDEQKSSLEKTYGNLNQQILKADNFKLWTSA